MILKYQPKGLQKFRETFEKMEGFSFLTPVTGLNRPNTGKDDDDDTCFSSRRDLSFPSGFRINILYIKTYLLPVRATCPVNLIFLDVMARIVFDEECNYIYTWEKRSKIFQSEVSRHDAT
jgi:hypothetical protein